MRDRRAAGRGLAHQGPPQRRSRLCLVGQVCRGEASGAAGLHLGTSREWRFCPAARPRDHGPHRAAGGRQEDRADPDPRSVRRCAEPGEPQSGMGWLVRQARSLSWEVVMTHRIVSHQDWMDASRALLVKEKQFTQLREEMARERRALPWEKVEKDYVFRSEERRVGKE